MKDYAIVLTGIIV